MYRFKQFKGSFKPDLLKSNLSLHSIFNQSIQQTTVQILSSVMFDFNQTEFFDSPTKNIYKHHKQILYVWFDHEMMWQNVVLLGKDEWN